MYGPHQAACDIRVAPSCRREPPSGSRQTPLQRPRRVIFNPDDGYPNNLGFSLELKGPKVVAHSTERNPQKFGQFPVIVTIPAGTTVERGLSFVWGGKRQWRSVWWEESGEYTLRVRCVGDGKEFEGFVTEPIKLKVTLKNGKG